jgi:hypothetical protein
MVVLRHLVGYMAAHADQCVSLKWKGIHSGVIKDYQMEDPILEIFSAADRQTRRSWDMHGLLLFSNSEGSIPSERRV